MLNLLTVAILIIINVFLVLYINLGWNWLIDDFLSRIINIPTILEELLSISFKVTLMLLHILAVFLISDNLKVDFISCIPASISIPFLTLHIDSGSKFYDYTLHKISTTVIFIVLIVSLFIHYIV